MDEDVAVRLEGLSKAYRIPRRGAGSLRGTLAVTWDALLGRKGRRHESAFRYFEALQPMDLEIRRGESVAIVGQNGSGKSTLLQMVAGTLEPTTGTVMVRGRLSALLQLGSGFNPEFTGLENVYLNAAILGLDRETIEEKLDAILAFADIGDFVEQPIKTYSSGMRVRLAFAVVTAVDPEILIVDEALSVGDAFFQSRCVRWLEDYVERKRTFLCVSHDMFLIKRLCQRGVVLEAGRVVHDDDVAEAANLYYRLHRKKPTVRRPLGSAEETGAGDDRSDGMKRLALNYRERTGDGRMTIEAVRACPDLAGGCGVGEWVQVEVDFAVHEPVESFQLGFGFRDRSGQLIGGYHSYFSEAEFDAPEAGTKGTLAFELQLRLPPDHYLLVVGLAIHHSAHDWHDLDCIWDCAKVLVSGPRSFWGLAPMPVRKVRYQTAGGSLASSS